MAYISREDISFSKCWGQLQNRRWKASVFILRLVFFTKVHILCYFVHGITNPYDYKNRGSGHIDPVSHSPGWRSADDVTMDCRWRQKCITRYNRNTLLLLDTVRQTSRGKSAASRWGIILRSTVRTYDISWFSLLLLLQNGSHADPRFRFAQKTASEKVFSSILAANKCCQSTAGYVSFETK